MPCSRRWLPSSLKNATRPRPRPLLQLRRKARRCQRRPRAVCGVEKLIFLLSFPLESRKSALLFRLSTLWRTASHPISAKRLLLRASDRVTGVGIRFVFAAADDSPPCTLRLPEKKEIPHFPKKVLAFSKTSTIIAPLTGYAPLAQLVEHLALNRGVQGSSP